MSSEGAPPQINGALVAATCGALLTLLPVAAHQLGRLRHLPDPPGSIFDSDAITESSMAHPWGVPDGLPGIVSYSGTLVLALLARDSSKARALLAAKLVADGSAASFNMGRQLAHRGKLCSWCTGTAICTALMILAGRKTIAAEASRLREL